MKINFSAPSLLEMKLWLHTTHLQPKGREGGEVDDWSAVNCFKEGITKLIPQFTTCNKKNGSYVEK
jgi:hypothetical protein